MNQINEQVEIQWPVTALFNYVSDITNNASWQRDVVEAEWVNRTDNRVGSVFAELKKSDGTSSHGEIVEFVPNKRRAIRTDEILLAMDFIPVSKEQTRIVMNMKWNSGMIRKNMITVVHEDLLRLKEILEQDC